MKGLVPTGRLFQANNNPKIQEKIDKCKENVTDTISSAPATMRASKGCWLKFWEGWGRM